MPQFLQAAATNERLTKVTMEFWDTDRTGVQRLHFVVTLTNASISEVKQHLASDLLTEDLSFTFQKIMVEDKIGKTTFTDDWSAVVL
jgi:type VI secretion system secreted protein Hcp